MRDLRTDRAHGSGRQRPLRLERCDRHSAFDSDDRRFYSVQKAGGRVGCVGVGREVRRGGLYADAGKGPGTGPGDG